MTTADESARDQSVRELLDDLRKTLEAGGIPEPRTDAELILGHVLGVGRGRVQALEILGERVAGGDAEAARGLAEERARRVPLQHLTGRAPFRGIELEVGPGVFVPRPETETVAQLALDALAEVRGRDPVAVDLCTGSGAIALALADEAPDAEIWAVELSPEAHAWASRNVARLGAGRVRLLRGDVRALGGEGTPGGECTSGSAREVRELNEARDALRGRADVVVSNPPYVPKDMVPRDPEVRDHDPALALYSGADGLDLIRAISGVARELAAPGGLLVLEHAEHQGAAIRALLAADGWRSAETHRDATDRDRATTAVR